MMDYYQILEIDRSANQDDIKNAYRKLAMKNHPDRGGDTKTFQKISEAYETLSDPQKRAEYDNRGRGHQFRFEQMDPSHMDFGPFGNINDIFGFTFGPGFQRHQVRRNKDLTIRISISLRQSYSGTQVEAKFNLPSGKSQTVAVDIPAGIHTGQTIRYRGLGDDSIPNMPRGDLNVNVMVEEDPEFQRQGNDLITTITINPIEAMLGCKKPIKCLDTELKPIELRPGTQPGSEFVTSGRGFKDINTGRQGNFVIRIKVEIPAITNTELGDKLKELYAQINNASK